MTPLRFQAIPLADAWVTPGPDGTIGDVHVRYRVPGYVVRAQYPGAELPRDLGGQNGAQNVAVIDSWIRDLDSPTERWLREVHVEGKHLLVRKIEAGRGSCCYIFGRWSKAAGELYGVGQGMQALPAIEVVNEAVRLILAHGEMALAGMWQAEDDGVLNPATVRLVPGAIIPKAPGSSGLTPLAAPGDFDVSQLVLDDLRARIRRALLADRLGPVRDSAARMTATEVIERSAETARLLGATYGRLQAELLTPLIARCLAILRRRGEAPPVMLDGREVRLRYASPLAQVQGRADAANTLLFLQAVRGLGAEGAAQVDTAAAARWLARTLGAPAEILHSLPPSTPNAIEE